MSGLDADGLRSYIARVHERTAEVVRALDDTHLGWRPAPGEMTCEELVRHIAGTRLMNSRIQAGERPRYDGHEVVAGTTVSALVELAATTAAESAALLRGLDFAGEVFLLNGQTGPAWSVALGALCEHEIHHRSQLCSYLSALGRTPPALHGVYAEDLPG